MATTLRRPDPMPSRAAQRKQRLLELENEQRLEDAEALKFTEEQRLSLFHSFRSVKFEWSDLDGMRSVRRRYNSSCPASPPPPPRSPAVQPHICVPHISISPPHLHQVQAQPVSVSPTSTPAAFAVLTNAHLASFGKDDTIRGHSHTLVAFPGSPQKYYGSTPTPYDSTLARAPPGLARSLSSPSAPASAPALAPAPPSVSRSYSSPPTKSSPPSPAPTRRSPPAYPSPKLSKSSPRGKRRSPVKGLFSPAAVSAVKPIVVPLPPLTLACGGGGVVRDGEGGEGGDEDEDAWVDDEEDDNATFIAGEEDEDDGLATPVPRAWGLPPTYDEEEPATPIPEVYEREATPTPYDYPRAYGGLQERGEREGEQVGGKRKR